MGVFSYCVGYFISAITPHRSTTGPSRPAGSSGSSFVKGMNVLNRIRPAGLFLPCFAQSGNLMGLRALGPA